METAQKAAHAKFMQILFKLCWLCIDRLWKLAMVLQFIQSIYNRKHVENALSIANTCTLWHLKNGMNDNWFTNACSLLNNCSIKWYMNVTITNVALLTEFSYQFQCNSLQLCRLTHSATYNQVIKKSKNVHICMNWSQIHRPCSRCMFCCPNGVLNVSFTFQTL